MKRVGVIVIGRILSTFVRKRLKITVTSVCGILLAVDSWVVTETVPWRETSM